MKLKEALRKFKFIKKLRVSGKAEAIIANHLAGTLKGSSEIYLTPIAHSGDPTNILLAWDSVFNANLHKMNTTLLAIEQSNRSKAGPRSIAVPWSDRVAGLRRYYLSQDESHVAKFNMPKGNANLIPVTVNDAGGYIKSSSGAGLPFLGKKRNYLAIVKENLNALLNRKDPCMLYTRTTEMKKTRVVWGYPFADTLFEMLFYIPLLRLQKHEYYRASLVSPDLVAIRITELIKEAIACDKILYSVDFAAFDANVKYQYIIEAFNFIASCYAPDYKNLISYVCERFYTIPIVTPSGIYHGKHAIPSGSTFTNEVDSIVQLGIALTCPFISRHKCQVQGDDGVYVMPQDNITEFEAAFEYAGMNLERSKSHIASNYVIFCQNLYHIDYLGDDGVIGGIYSTYRALNRILYQERFNDLAGAGITGKDYFGIRTLSILENCKYHPLHYELVKFVVALEKFTLDISDDGIVKYCTYMNRSKVNGQSLNHQYGSEVLGIKKFVSYTIAMELLADEEPVHNFDGILSEVGLCKQVEIV